MTTFFYPRRVHIAPVGFEIDRVVLPILKMEGDRVYLITGMDQKKDEAYHFLQEIQSSFQKERPSIEILIRSTDIPERDLFETLKVYRQIIEEEEGNHIFINVSTGTKIHAIAGSMASMMFSSEQTHLTPYYVTPEKYVPQPAKQEQLTIGCKKIQKLPNYRIERPSEEEVTVLSVICSSLNSNGKISKKDLIRELDRRQIPLLSGPVSHESQAKYRALERRYIEPLLNWHFITVERQKRNTFIQVTDEGRQALVFLET